MRRRADHPGGLEQLDAGQPHADPADAAQVTDGPTRPAAASKDALLRRLATLAPWHPSAIRVGDRQAGERQAAGRPGSDQPGIAQLASGDPEPDKPKSEQPEAERAQPEPTESERAQPECAESEREEPERAQPERAESGQDSPAGPTRPPGPDRPPPDAPEGSFWDKVPWFRSLWRDHVQRWPERPSEPSRPRPDDPKGTWRGEGDRSLNPAHNAEADEQIELLQGPEKAVTSLLRQIEHENPHGGVLVGLDHRLKGPDRLKQKIADKMTVKAGTSVEEAAAMIDDAVRYTFCFSNSEYVAGHDDAQQRLISAGYTMIHCENHWLEDPQYKGVNSRWQTPSGDRFELQFHTRESFYAKEQLTHVSYERLRQQTTSRQERTDLEAFERLVSSAVPAPPGVAQISDHKVRKRDA